MFGSCSKNGDDRHCSHTAPPWQNNTALARIQWATQTTWHLFKIRAWKKDQHSCSVQKSLSQIPMLTHFCASVDEWSRMLTFFKDPCVESASSKYVRCLTQMQNLRCVARTVLIARMRAKKELMGGTCLASSNVTRRSTNKHDKRR